MKKRKVTIAQAQKIQEKMCLEGRLTIEEAERVFDLFYKKERSIIQKPADSGRI